MPKSFKRLTAIIISVFCTVYAASACTKDKLRRDDNITSVESGLNSPVLSVPADIKINQVKILLIDLPVMLDAETLFLSEEEIFEYMPEDFKPAYLPEDLKLDEDLTFDSAEKGEKKRAVKAFEGKTAFALLRDIYRNKSDDDAVELKERRLTVEVQYDEIPTADFIFEFAEDAEPSIIKGHEVLIGKAENQDNQSLSGDAADDEIIYIAQFMHGNIGYRLSSFNLGEAEFLNCLISLPALN